MPEEQWLANKRHEQTHLHRAIRKYGEENFRFEIIEICDAAELNDKEKFWIKFYNSYDASSGYNMTLGGDGYSVLNSEDAPGAKITKEESKLIKEKLKERWTAEEIIKLVPKIGASTISAINYGKIWYDENENYPLSINNGHRTWSDEEALQIKQQYAKGETIKKLAEIYQVNINTISDLVHGKTYTNLPVIEREVEWKRVNEKTRKLSPEEVKFYRDEVNNNKKSMLEIFNQYNPPMGYAAFRNMIKGITYKNVGI